MSLHPPVWNPPPRRLRQAPPGGGFALVTVLICIALLTVLIVSIFSLASSERVRADAYAKEAMAQLLAQNAVSLVVGQVRQATASADPGGSPLAWASQPGMIRTYDSAGKPYVYYKLYSWDGMIGTAGTAFKPFDPAEQPDSNWASETGVYTDLNAPVNGHYPIVDPTFANTTAVEGFTFDLQSTVVANAPATSKLPMPAKWIYILRDGTMAVGTAAASGGTAATVAAATAANPIMGRVAFWTDDETCKVNVNTASEGTFWDVPHANSYEDHSNHNNAPGFSTSTPLTDEFQRTPGHPATTSLSTVLGKMLPLPGDYPYLQTADVSQLENYYNLVPKAGTGGSQAGTVFVVDSNGNPTATLKTHSNRLYASVDEMVFDPLHTKAPPAPNGTIDPPTLDQLRFMLTADSAAPEVNLFNKPRISIWPIQADTGSRNAKDSLLAFCSTLPPTGTGAQPYYFQRATTYAGDGNPGSSQSATADCLPASRNQALLNYLDTLASQPVPGFGAASLKDKYGADLPQILTEAFDYTRSLVNTTSQALAPKYNYVPYGAAGGTYNQATSIGSVTPIRLPAFDGQQTQGMGRNYTIREVSLDFYASDWVDNTGFGPPSKDANGNDTMNTVSGSPDGLPDDEKLEWMDAAGNAIPGADGKPQYTYAGVGCPRTASISAFLTFTPFCISPGQPTFSPALRYEITGLDAFAVNGQSLGFPSDAVEVVRNKFHWTSESEGGVLGTLVSHATSPKRGDYWPGRVPSQAAISGITSQADQDDAAEKVYPFYGNKAATVTPSVNLPRFGLDRTGNVIDRTYQMPFGGPPLQPPTPAVAGVGGRWKWVRNIEAPGANTFAFTGKPIHIYVFKGTGNTFNTSRTADNPDFIQDLTINFPSSTSLPVPQAVRAQINDDNSNTFPLPSGNGINGWDGTNGGNPLKDVSFYTGFPDLTNATPPGDIPLMPSADSRKIAQRFTGYVPAYTVYPAPSAPRSNNGVAVTAPARSQPSYIDLSAITHPRLLYRRGDVVRSMTVDPLNGAKGDLRLVAATTSVPSSWFAPTVFPMPSNPASIDGLAAYNDPNSFQVYSLLACRPSTIESREALGFEDYGRYGQTNSGALTYDYYGNPFSWIGPTNKSLRGTLLPISTSGFSVNQDVPSTAVIGLNGASLTSNAASLPGDWDNGPGNEKDGSFINKADEGYGANGQYNDIYFTSYPKYNNQTTLNSYSPNRQICSPVSFGSLPTGVKRGLPWQTLLFCPNPAAGNSHPGFGVAAAGSGPQVRAPYTVLPDHLFLDLFWMPVIEPYAISNPLETSGKVNMNFQIVPYTYIERSTAVRAVLKSTRVTAIDPKASNFKNTPLYKVAFNSGWGDTGGTSPAYRYPLNLDATIQGGFDARFNDATNPDIFRSASEICDVFLVPKEPTNLPSGSVTQASLFGSTSAPPSPGGTQTGVGGVKTGNSSYDTVAQGWWDNFKLTGDNSRESPYNQIYPRLTTKSNTYQVHVRAQVLTKRSGGDPTIFDESKGDTVGSEYRGSSIVARYVDLNDPALSQVDFAAPASTATLDNFYRYRVVKETAFNP